MRTKFSGILTLLLALVVQISFAQQKTVTGTVTDDTGMPLPGANIIIKNTSTGTQSDFDGNYSITASSNQVLVFSYVGFETKEVTVGSQTQINMTLEPGNVLDAIVITSFGRKLTRNESTSSVVTIDSEALEKSPFVDMQQALQGRVAGMTVAQTSGAPGAPAEIRIRGMNSITAGKSPLYVIDGIPISSGNIGYSENNTGLDMMSLIGNLDIESISILKDATAVAPYGAEGANGVILITTKSGKEGHISYTFDYTTGVQNRAVDGVKMMNGAQKAEAMALGYVNNGRNASNMEEAYEYMYERVPGYRYWIDAGRPDVNWSDAVTTKDAIMKNGSFSVTKGTQDSNIYASLGFNNTDGTVIGSEFQRVNGSFKYNTNLNEKLTLSVSANVANVSQEGVLENGGYFSNPNLSRYFMSPWAPPYLPDGSFNIGDEWDQASSLHNTLYTSTFNQRNNDVTRAIQNTRVSYDILDNLTFTSTFGLDYTLAYGKEYRNPIHGDGESLNGYVYERSDRLFQYTTQNTLDWNFTLGENHNFNLTGVQEYSKYKDFVLVGQGSNFPNQYLYNLSAASADFSAYSGYDDRMSMRYIGMLSYNFNQRYLLDASFSHQGDSRFSKKFGNFYAIGAAWNLHREAFLEDSDFVNELRLRGGHGVTGNANIARNRYQSLKGYSSYREMSAAYVFEYGTTATWERSVRLDGGIDFSFLNRRINGSVGYYANETQDMLFNVPLPVSSTYTGGSVLQNVGNMTNKGLEVDINADIIRTDDVIWNLGGNFSTLSNRVTVLPEDAEVLQTTWVLQQGRMVYEWYLKEWAGVDPANGDPLWYVNRETNGDETTNNYADADQMYQGTSRLPKFSGSLMTRVDVKNFFLEAQLYFAGGHKIFQNWATYVQTTDVGQFVGMNSSLAAYENAWREPGDNATYPRFDQGSAEISNAASASTRWLHDGDFMRLRDLGFGYSFNSDQLKNTFINGLTLSVRGTNLFTWLKDDRLEYDPEVETGIGFSNLTTPPIKTITFNINLNF
jgi:TonB-linked SusC/RagA family outer membrane protein